MPIQIEQNPDARSTSKMQIAVTDEKLKYYTLAAWNEGKFEKISNDRYRVQVNNSVFKAAVTVQVTNKGLHGCVGEITIMEISSNDNTVANAA